jgi:hypothetical protein
MGKNDHPFRYTPVNPKEPGVRIKRKDQMLWLGSCFVDSLQPFLHQHQYQARVNPFGTVFHPIVLGRLLELNPEEFDRFTFEKDGVWLNYRVGQPLIADSEAGLNAKFEAISRGIKNRLTTSKWLVMTWGTAFFYEHKELGMIGKCHKQPGEIFTKKMSSPDEISRFWIEKIQSLRKENSGLKILLTLSPVRHTRDGLEENSISKASLRLAIEQVRQELPEVYYFPSYEIMMDELRDYRFFGPDLIHPNPEAVQYIWERFSAQFLVPEEVRVNQLIRDLHQLENHKPFAEFGEEYLRWKKAIEIKKADLERQLASESA